MRSEVTAFIGLGANLGDARKTLQEAVSDIAALPGCQITRQSSLYGTAPMESSGPDYINAAVEIRTTLTAPALLGHLQMLEAQAGRVRPYRNAPRTLDLDLLLFGDACIQSAALTVPHPRMFLRAFVLVPLAEIAPHHVSAMQLHAVQSQAISRLPE